MERGRNWYVRQQPIRQRHAIPSIFIPSAPRSPSRPARADSWNSYSMTFGAILPHWLFIATQGRLSVVARMLGGSVAEEIVGAPTLDGTIWLHLVDLWPLLFALRDNGDLSNNCTELDSRTVNANFLPWSLGPRALVSPRCVLQRWHSTRRMTLESRSGRKLKTSYGRRS